MKFQEEPHIIRWHFLPWPQSSPLLPIGVIKAAHIFTFCHESGEVPIKVDMFGGAKREHRLMAAAGGGVPRGVDYSPDLPEIIFAQRRDLSGAEGTGEEGHGGRYCNCWRNGRRGHLIGAFLSPQFLGRFGPEMDANGGRSANA